MSLTDQIAFPLGHKAPCGLQEAHHIPRNGTVNHIRHVRPAQAAAGPLDRRHRRLGGVFRRRGHWLARCRAQIDRFRIDEHQEAAENREHVRVIRHFVDKNEKARLKGAKG